MLDPPLVLSPSTTPVLLRRGLALEYITLSWNVVGTGVVIAAALAAGSVALAGFGLDSLIEIAASVVVVWQLKNPGDARERQALRLIGGAFIALAIYIASQAAYTLITAKHPHSSTLGITWTAATVAVMLALAAGKARTGTALNNSVLQTEGRVTLIDAYLAAAVRVGLALNAAIGWWWADPLAGLVIVYYGLREATRHSPTAHVRGGRALFLDNLSDEQLRCLVEAWHAVLPDAGAHTQPLCKARFAGGQNLTPASRGRRSAAMRERPRLQGLDRSPAAWSRKSPRARRPGPGSPRAAASSLQPARCRALPVPSRNTR